MVVNVPRQKADTPVLQMLLKFQESCEGSTVCRDRISLVGDLMVAECEFFT